MGAERAATVDPPVGRMPAKVAGHSPARSRPLAGRRGGVVKAARQHPTWKAPRSRLGRTGGETPAPVVPPWRPEARLGASPVPSPQLVDQLARSGRREPVSDGPLAPSRHKRGCPPNPRPVVYASSIMHEGATHLSMWRGPNDDPPPLLPVDRVPATTSG